MPSPPPRLHVLLASQARLGLVIRRGPTRKVATILWDRKSDEFKLGQWFKGRIYERRCDLSPNGNFFLYFAMNGKSRSETGGSWSAVSKAPFLKAIALYPKRDCWHGGGMWTTTGTYWLCGKHEVLRESSMVRRDTTYVMPPFAGFHGSYCVRHLRDGWTLLDEGALETWPRHMVFEKPLRRGWILRKVLNAAKHRPKDRGTDWDHYEIVHPESGTVLPCPEWEWADLDHRRLVWAAQGKLFTAQITKHGPADERELFDFGPMAFEAIEAPY